MDVPMQVDKAACVVCGSRAQHMVRDKTFQLRSVCMKHCGCCGDSSFLLRESWPAWNGRHPGYPDAQPEWTPDGWDHKTPEQQGVQMVRPPAPEQVELDKAAAFEKSRRGSVQFDPTVTNATAEYEQPVIGKAYKDIQPMLAGAQENPTQPKRRGRPPKSKGGDANG